MTKLVFALPQSARERILEDPDNFIAFAKEQGFDIIAVSVPEDEIPIDPPPRKPGSVVRFLRKTTEDDLLQDLWSGTVVNFEKNGKATVASPDDLCAEGMDVMRKAKEDLLGKAWREGYVPVYCSRGEDGNVPMVVLLRTEDEGDIWAWV